MYVAMNVPACDFRGTNYPKVVEGAGCLAQGATGRWCVVMYAGPEWLAAHNITPITHEDALTEIEELGGYADF